MQRVSATIALWALIVTGLLTPQPGSIVGKEANEEYVSRYELREVATEPFPDEPEFAACPAQSQLIGYLSGMVRRDRAPLRASYEVALDYEAALVVIGFAKEGHPENCPDGVSCGQGQLHEEFSVAVNEELIGGYYDQTSGDAWFAAGPWRTVNALPADAIQIDVAHLGTGTTAESVSYKLTVCANTLVNETPTATPTSTSTVTPLPTITPRPTPPYEEPAFAVCPDHTVELARFADTLSQSPDARRREYSVEVPYAADLLLTGSVKEGHPESCPDGANCGQRQCFEEFRVAINDQEIGRYLDQTVGDAWFVAGPWKTASPVSDGVAQVVFEHLLRGLTAESVSYKLTLCARTAPTEDREPPVVEFFLINDDAAFTESRPVSLTVRARDPEPGTGVESVLFVEFIYNNDIGEWYPVHVSEWLPYREAPLTYPWTLSIEAGIRYMQAWARDGAGNISLYPGVDGINYVVATEFLDQGETQVYRLELAAGQQFTARVEPVMGDPDLYVWPPDYGRGRPPWISNLRNGSDRITFIAPITGVYQIEVFGYTASEYRIYFETGILIEDAFNRNTAGVELGDSEKSKPTEPTFGLSSIPGSEWRWLATHFTYRVFLPVIQIRKP